MRFLRGGQAMDRHFCAAAPHEKHADVAGLVGIWHNQICDYATRAVLPYDQRLGQLPDYLQQLEMESNGKSTLMDGPNAPITQDPSSGGQPAPMGSTHSIN